MPARTKGVQCLALIKKDAGLIFPGRQLGTVFDFSGTGFRQPMHKFFACFVKPFQNFQKNDVVCAHI